eukprot:CAMPEP_0184495612 /NCGR_PEP_ID=MMETSP0113_2-20130426/31843_1 /TAXON_ID=91329 /ORGANISM="Norrisiella sphaerica, Strain BC52" /LENGTH=365 /DNA_ID=CAMNT_0026881871 /DNA_START=124 /DNA_END=1224 /DNA_ORIENTATION=+
MPQHSEQVVPVPCPLLTRTKETEPQVELMTCSELLNLMSGRNVILVDTRSAEDFKKEKLMKAINVPVDSAFIENIPSAKDMMRTIKGTGRFQLNGRVRPGKITVIVSNDGKLDAQEPAGAMAKVLKDASTLCVLEGGFAAFATEFPFAVNKLTLPWFPTVLIKDFLYLGSEDDAKHQKHLQDLKITHVLNVSSDVKNYFPDEFKYHRIDLPDEIGSNLMAHFTTGFEYLKVSDKDVNKRVLVHCHQGVSRSSTMVLAYLMHSKHWTLEDAYKFTKAQRPVVCPNPGFWRQLEKFEIQLFGKSTLNKCVDIEAEEREYKAKNGNGDVNQDGEIGDDDDDDDGEALRTTRTVDTSVADDKCDVCVLL